jgi:DNA-binding winged helix-turn-helix (wHTH) protein
MPDGRISGLAFGRFRLFPAERRLEKDGKPVPAVGRAFDLLVVLAERAGEVAEQDAHRKRLARRECRRNQPTVSHQESAQAAGDPGADNRYVRNVAGRGYCFAAPVERLAEAGRRSDSDPFAARSNLPARASAIVGRSDSIDTLTRELSKRRLVTIAGPGGIGKTTLAIVTAQTLRSSFHNGVFFVDLAPIEDPSSLSAPSRRPLEPP